MILLHWDTQNLMPEIFDLDYSEYWLMILNMPSGFLHHLWLLRYTMLLIAKHTTNWIQGLMSTDDYCCLLEKTNTSSKKNMLIYD